MGLNEKMLKVITTLSAPKSQYNLFGKYSYRSCEDILEALKPLLKENGLTVTISDEVVLIGDRYYIKATSTATDIETGEKTSATAYAREDETKKGMDLAQVTGSVSSYSRKYSLNGLFCIDDNKDSDETNTHDSESKTKKTQQTKSAATTNAQDKEAKPTVASKEQKKKLFDIAKEKGLTDGQDVSKLESLATKHGMNLRTLSAVDAERLINIVSKIGEEAERDPY